MIYEKYSTIRPSLLIRKLWVNLRYILVCHQIGWKNDGINEFCGIILKEGKQRVIVEIDESRLYDNQAFDASEEQRAVALSYIREIADVDFYNKISDTVRDVFSAVIDADYLK